MFHFTRLPLPPCIHEPLHGQPVFGDHSRSDRRSWGTRAAPPLGEQLRNVTQPQPSDFPSEKAMRCSRQGAGGWFPWAGWGHPRRGGRRRRCLPHVLASGGTSIKSHQEGLSSFLYSNARKRPVSVIRFKKRFYYLVYFCLKKIIIKINRYLLNLSCHLLSHYTPRIVFSALHTGAS